MVEIIKQKDANGILTTFEITGKDTFNVIRSQDVAQILERNKSLQNDSDYNNGYTEHRDMKHVASIPLVVFESWAKKYGITKSELYGQKGTEILRKELNDPDNAFLRTGLGEI